MLRYFKRFCGQVRLSHVPVIQFSSIQAIPVGQKLRDNYSMTALKTYYGHSDRYKTFQRHSQFLYEFDSETRNLTKWDSPINQDVDWEQPANNLTNDELICAFENLTNYCTANKLSLSDTQFDQFIDSFIDRLQDFSLNEVIRGLQIFAKIDMSKHIVKQRNYIDLFQAFDQACTVKSLELLPDQLLYLSSIWLDIPCTKHTYIAQLIARLLNRYMKSMSPSEVAQSLFFINCTSQPIDDIRRFENIFEEIMDQMTLHEFTTVMWTFIRLETKMEKQELREKYFNYLERHDLSTLDEPELTKILIITSRMVVTSITRSAQWAKIMKNLGKSMENKSLKIGILIANVGLPIRQFDDEMMELVYQRCLEHPDELNNLSMPDLEYLSRILSMYKSRSHANDDVIKNVGFLLLEELKDRLDCVAQRGVYQNFVNIIRNLTNINIYDVELIDNLFRPDYIKRIHKNSKQLDMQMYEIDGFTRINLKDIYKGNRLEDAHLQRMCFLIDWIPDRNKYKKKSHEFVYTIEDVVRNLFEHCRFVHVIPYRRHADLVVCVDVNTLKSVDVSENFPPLYSGQITEARALTKDNPNLLTFAIIASNTKEFLNDDRNKCENIPIGYLAQKVQQLELLGFHPIVVPIRLLRQNDSKMAIERFIVAEINEKLCTIGVDKTLKTTLNRIEFS